MRDEQRPIRQWRAAASERIPSTAKETVAVLGRDGSGPYTCTPGMDDSPDHSRATRACSRSCIAPYADRSRSRRVAPSPSDARNSTAAAAPTIPSWFCVPVSRRSGARVGGGPQLRRVERLQEVAPAVEDADVRPVKLVGRARQEVAIQGPSDVDQAVRRIMHGVDENQGAGGMGQTSGLGPRR